MLLASWSHNIASKSSSRRIVIIISSACIATSRPRQIERDEQASIIPNEIENVCLAGGCHRRWRMLLNIVRRRLNIVRKLLWIGDSEGWEGWVIEEIF
jgi:hypothetical protein